MSTPDPAQGTWILVAPDGRKWEADHPLKCLRAEIDARVPAQVQLARILAAVDEPDFAERHLGLGKFYNAKNVDDLVDKMEAHIQRLQIKLAERTPPFSFAPTNPRIG